MKEEVVEVTIKGKRGKLGTQVDEDEEYKKVNVGKFGKLATVFQVSVEGKEGGRKGKGRREEGLRGRKGYEGRRIEGLGGREGRI